MNFILKSLFFIFILSQITIHYCLEIFQVNEKNCKNTKMIYDSDEGYKTVCEKIDCKGDYRYIYLIHIFSFLLV